MVTEFAKNLNQQAQDLKLNLITSRSGNEILSNLNEQIFTSRARAQGNSDIGLARAVTGSTLAGIQDSITLAQSSRDRRQIERELPFITKQLQLREELVKLQNDSDTKEEDLLNIKQQILELELERLEANKTINALLQDEFVFTQKEINQGLKEGLVGNARTFVDTISDGLVDAIAKGKNLGDVLRQAAASFFLSEAQNRMSAAFKGVTSSIPFLANDGGRVTGGSGTRDDVPALLTGGEFVMRRSAVEKFGPRFMEAINSGNIPMFNTGGMFTPGTFGQGAIRGKSNLLNFATQSFTGGRFDSIGGSGGLGFASLEPQSGRLTMFGRRNSPMFQKEQDSKREAFGLFARQSQLEKEAREREKQQRKALFGSILAFVGATVAQGVVGAIRTNPNTAAANNRAIMLNNDGTQMTAFQRFMAFSGINRKATGGYIQPTSGVDTVPAMLSGGEFVMNAAATQRIGRDNLAAANSGATGGDDAVISRLDELISVSGNKGETVINITVNSDGSENQDGNGEQDQQNFAKKIRDVVKQTISDEQRLGGTLRRR